MDRCALFVDAGYLLADGAMAVHGTRRRESVSWDYAGLLQLLGSLAREHSGLPLLRCYWYEATVEGRRSADHDALADLPGVKLRLAKMRPGRREGVESEIRRDLEALARNRAVSDAMVVSAEEDLAQVVADVQDLGLRVSLLHIAVDGNWTISRTLRQECDDIVEISAEHLRPFAELIPGAEPLHADEHDGAPLIALRPVANGHGAASARRASSHARVQAGQDTDHQAPPPIYTAPVVAEYQRPAPQLAWPHPDEQLAAGDDAHGEPAAVREAPAGPDLQPAGQDVAAAPRDVVAAAPDPALAAADFLAAPLDASAVQPDALPARQEAVPARQDQPPVRQDQPPVRPDLAAGPWEPQPAARQDFGAWPEQSADFAAAWSHPAPDLSGYSPGVPREPLPRDAIIREQLPREQLPREQLPREQLPGDAGDGPRPVPAASGSAQIHRLPTRGADLPPQAPGPGPGPGPGQPMAGHPMPGQPTAAQPVLSAPTAAQPAIGIAQPGAPGAPAAPVVGIPSGAGYPPGHNGVYSGPQPIFTPGSQPGGTVVQPAFLRTGAAPPGGAPTGPGSAHGQGTAGVTPVTPLTPVAPVAPPGRAGPAGFSSALPAASLAEAVQSAHDEGQEFGAAVARDAPALWLEAVLARKPRMPSDLEARLLQGSALPIDYLLHDEVRHALRRGFWDAMERARR